MKLRQCSRESEKIMKSLLRKDFNDISLSRYDIRLCRMIYMQDKYDIISVPSYAERISDK